MNLVDNAKGGLSINLGGDGVSQVIRISDMTIYGESEAKDCWSQVPSDNACFCTDKFGFMLAVTVAGSKNLHPVKKSEEPLYKIKTNGSFNGEVFVDNVTFKDWTEFGSADCGSREQFIFERNPSAADYIPMHNFDGCTFDNVEEGAFAWIEKPDPAWATTTPLTSPDNCGDYPCTGPENVVLSFKNTQYNNNIDLIEETSFQVISNNDEIVDDTCVTYQTEWEAYRCNNEALGVLIFESLDADNEDRELQPVYIIDEDGNQNKINSYMDHGWDGFYTSQKRL